EAERLQREYAQSRLQALKSQVNPHFLFNSLSVLSELVQQDAELSEKFIHHLSKAYRYILEQKDSQLVTVEEELAFLDAYFFLLQIRFGKKIQLQKNVNPACMACQVPPLTLQLLVENAVKHNKMSGLEPLIIYLTINEQQLEVRNAIRRRDEAASGTGIGIENIKRRVAHATDKPVLIEDDGKTFTITIPLMPPTFKVPERV
ncbi:MAG TPA: histidine kinase, partial [Phnomibacter sp.]|nr:histidine kinase [Phnomibacter sp.]